MKNSNELLNLVQGLPKQRLAVVCAEDEMVFDAIIELEKRNLIEPILIGNLKDIEKLLASKSVNPSSFKILPSETKEEAAKIAIGLIRDKEADFLMKGSIDTKTLLKEVVNKETGIRIGKLLSHIALFSFPTLNRVLLATDCAMNIAPDIDAKIGLIENAVSLAQTLGYQKPKVALISASEKVNPKLISSVEAEQITEHFKNEKNYIVEGPFALDNVVSLASSRHKGLSGEVAGAADILVFPNLDAGNIFYKTSVFLANADVAGLIVGASCPIVLTSRSDSSLSKRNSILMAMVYNYGIKNTSN